MTQLRALAKEYKLRGYSRLRKADLINFINESLHEDEPHMGFARAPGPIEQPQKDETLNEKLNETLSKRQLKRRRNKASKLSKKSKNLRIEINDLKSKKDDIEDKIARASSSTSTRFKRKKIRSMKREATKINERIEEKTKELKTIKEKTKELKTIEVNQTARTSQQSKENKRIRKKIEDINRKIRRAKGKSKRNLMIKRDSLSWLMLALD